ncbi:Tellurite resistance protein TerB [Candidatus Magnetomorum sp. HK-1]|nr:Tellurite resistance protein TerB [Candidatus Magnetomorum sp. HK-1]
MKKYKNKKPVDPDTVWIPAGKKVTVAGKKIPGGMIYVGNYLQAENKYSRSNIDPALINPKLRVRWLTTDYTAALIGYWPSYSEMHSTCRAHYLNWLISGRKDPTCNIGYVYLFFYGLERRFYVDSKTSVSAQKEIPSIIDEVKRLIAIYGSNKYFYSYANKILEANFVKQHSKSFYDCKPPKRSTTKELPMPLLLGLGQFASESKPVPSDWAYAWLMLHPETRLKMPAKRCKKEFKTLFRIHYTKKYNDGMIIKPSKIKIELKYITASSGISDIKIPCGNLTDVSLLKTPINQLNKIVENCTNALKPLSRFLAKNADQADSINSLLVMPEELIKETDHPKAKKIKKTINSLLADQQEKFVHNAKLLELLSGAKNNRLTKKESMKFAQLLENFDIGIEPDPRFSGISLNGKEKIILFKLPQNAPKTIFKEYKTATIILHLAAIISWADGTVNHSERLFMEKYLEKTLDISLGEKIRLKAHLSWLLKELPGMAGVKKRIELLKNNEKKTAAAFCIGVAGADGHIDPSEIKALTKIYTLLGFQNVDVYVDIHSMMSFPSVSPADGPVSVQKVSKSTGGYKIPSKSTIGEMQNKGVDLDMNIVQTKLKETAEVSQILGDIFEEDTVEEIVPIPEKQKIDTKTIGSLDVEHSELFNKLIKQPEWQREDFEALVEKSNLLPDGALDMINEAAYEICDEPLIDGDDPILVDMDVAKEMII